MVIQHHLRKKNTRQAKAFNSLQKLEPIAPIRALIRSPDFPLKKDQAKLGSLLRYPIVESFVLRLLPALEEKGVSPEALSN
jgi:hypothetical protein